MWVSPFGFQKFWGRGWFGLDVLKGEVDVNFVCFRLEQVVGNRYAPDGCGGVFRYVPQYGVQVCGEGLYGVPVKQIGGVFEHAVKIVRCFRKVKDKVELGGSITVGIWCENQFAAC